jgi:glycosyltransferase involved in cell wall biosynthesis
VAGRTIRVCAVRQFPFDTHLRREVDALLDAGHEVDVVCMSGDGRPRRERRGRLTIWRMPVQHRRGGRGRYVVEHAAFVTAAALTVAGLHVRRRFDVVQVNSPPDSVVLAALVPKLTGTPLLLDLVESTPEFFATRFGTPDTHPVARLLAGVEQRSIRFADHAITGTRHMRERFAARGADATRIDVVLNASDERFFDPALAPPASEPADDTFTLVCHGSIEPRYGLDTAIRFEIYGEGSARAELERLARELGVDDRVRFHGFVAIDELVAALARADAGVVAVKRDPFRDLTHTNKMFDFVAMRRPAIVSWTRSVADYFDEEALEYFRSDDSDDLARAIREVRRDPRRRQAMVRRAGELYEAYRWPRQREIYVAAVENLAFSRIGRVSTRKPA